MLLSVSMKVLSRVILNRITDIADPLLRKEQAGFRKGRSCADQIFTLRQILEQSNEWNSPLYINFIDFTKAFDSVNRLALEKILSHYGIPDKIISIIKMLYTDLNARVICGSNLSEEFKLQTGVKQGCLLSPLLFTFCIDWIMRETIKNKRTGITWAMTEMLEDLDFADDIALLSHRHRDMQEKTKQLAETARKIGLKINDTKTKVIEEITQEFHFGDKQAGFTIDPVTGKKVQVQIDEEKNGGGWSATRAGNGGTG